MRNIERPWLRQIPGYAPQTRRQSGAREPGRQDPAGEQAPAEAQDGSDPLEEQSAEGVPSGEGREADGQAEHGAAPVEPPPLSIPDDVERLREEEERRGARRNRNLAPRAFALEGHYVRRLATQFARMVSKVAEDWADMPDQGDEEWDMAELLRRRFTGRLVSQCRMSREKRKVAVVLDTSPSCEHQARLFAAIARIGEELGDCELYDAPNFSITAHRPGDAWAPLPAQEVAWQFRNRVVLAFGDFDGIERISLASAQRGNRIYWFCCEVRPQVLEHEREYFVRHYKGRYFPATNTGQLMRAMRRVR